MNEHDLKERLAESVGGRERLADFFRDRTFSDLHQRAERELNDGVAAILDAVRRTEKAIEEAGLSEYWSGERALVNVLVRLWAMYQNAGSRVASWAIVGPSNFPVRRMQKRIDAEQRRYDEFATVAAKAPERALRIARATQRARIGAGGLAELELEDLRKRLADREAKQAQMKGINELIRKNRLGNRRDQAEEDAAKLVQLARAAGFPMVCSVAYQLLTPDWGKPGYPAYSLSNNNAEIHRLRDRVAQVEAKVARIENAPEEAPEREVAGVKLIEDSADDRLRLVFPGKPAPDVIRLLKSRGFRWSPRNEAWQRQLTPNARYAAEAVLNQLNKEAA